MNITTLLEIAKISPYLVIPALFGFLLWKLSKTNTEFTHKVILDKGQQFDALNLSIVNLTNSLMDKFSEMERELRNGREDHNKDTLESINRLSDKLTSLQLEIARGNEK